MVVASLDPRVRARHAPDPSRDGRLPGGEVGVSPSGGELGRPDVPRPRQRVHHQRVTEEVQQLTAVAETVSAAQPHRVLEGPVHRLRVVTPTEEAAEVRVVRRNGAYVLGSVELARLVLGGPRERTSWLQYAGTKMTSPGSSRAHCQATPSRAVGVLTSDSKLMVLRRSDPESIGRNAS